MSTRETIVQLGDQLIRAKGFSAFSFYDIAKKLRIKNASIHYHFPTKANLGISILKEQRKSLQAIIQAVATKSPTVKLNAFLSIYSKIKSEGRVCLVGSLATGLNSVDKEMTEELRLLAREIVVWVKGILEEGRRKEVFFFSGSARTKALLIITNMLAALQLSRLTNQKDFVAIRNSVIKDLKSKK